MSETKSPLAALSAPWITGRPLRPLITTSRCLPRVAQQARNGGNARTVVSSPNHTGPPAATLAAACSATAVFLGVGRVGPTEHELGTLVAVAQPMQRAPHRPFARGPAPFGECGAHQGRGPGGGRIPVHCGSPSS